MRREILTIFTTFISVLTTFAMDFGLRFRSNDVAGPERTLIDIKGGKYSFDKEFKIGFYFNFYATPMFGNILSVKTDDGQRISVVGSAAQDGTYRLALVVNDGIRYIKTPLVLDPGKEDHVDLTFNKEKGTVVLSMNNIDISSPIDLSSTKSVSAVFGRDVEAKLSDVAPIELRNIRIFRDGNNTNHWDFKYHETDSTAIDDIGGHTAIVRNPYWLINDHTDWHPVYALKSAERIQTAFNEADETFYIVSNDSISAFDPHTYKISSLPIQGGHRCMAFSNHLHYDSIARRIINYNLQRGISNTLDLQSRIWSNAGEASDDEPNYSNHAVAVTGDSLITFGGYGFYKFHDDVFTVNLRSGHVSEHRIFPPIMPMTSSAGAVVGDTLYIFGGKGNDSGMQELPSRHSYALYAYDTKTWKGRKAWELESVDKDFIPSQTMYYDKEDDCFYFASTSYGGQLMSISREKPELKVLSTGIESKMDFYDSVFDLYRSKDEKRYYLVIDKRLDAKNHDLAIYTISAPFLDDENAIFSKTMGETPALSENKTSSVWLWISVGIAVVLAIGITLLLLKKRQPTSTTTGEPIESINHENPESVPASTVSEPLRPTPNVIENESKPADTPKEEPTHDQEEEDFSFIALAGQKADSHHFDRSKASISFLGGFCVRDKEGNDITVKFTARIKHLLVMLLLSSLKYESGIKYQLIDEEIWKDKDEKSAQNNRNVSLRKLRLLLEEVGNIGITYDKGFFKIDTDNVLFDYKELKGRIDEIEGSETVSPDMVDELLELLLMGPMLPNTTYDWLDQYKADFSNSALEILTKLLKYEIGKDDDLAYRIAETISLHDTLNEEALLAKCSILSRRKMHGLAKNIYAKFCKEYLQSMGEEFPISFAEACKGNA